jgi:DNA-directed RNA polymerase II subunit RPB2
MSPNLDLLEALVHEHGLVSHQLDSYNHFVRHGIERIVNEENRIRLAAAEILTITSPEVAAPSTATPSQCRLTDSTYEATVYVTLKLVPQGPSPQSQAQPQPQPQQQRVVLFRLPVMVGSMLCSAANLRDECMYDPGGWFVIRGKERVLVTQERNAYNTVVCNIAGDTVTAEMRSMSIETGHSALTTVQASMAGCKYLATVPFINTKIPVGIVFKAVGYATDAEIRALLLQVGCREDRLLKTLLRESSHIHTREEAVAYLAVHVSHTTDQPVKYAEQVVAQELFPHLGALIEPAQTALVLAQFVRHIFHVQTLDDPGEMDLGPVLSKDHLVNKRFEPAGTLIFDLLRTSYKRFVRSLGPLLVKHGTSNVSTIAGLWSKTNGITKDLRYSFLTGSWGLSRNSYIKTGVSQVLCRLNYVATVSHLRRVNVFLGREVKNINIRYIHQSTYGYICPSETPEGACVGIVKNLALTSYVSVDVPPALVFRAVMRTGLVDAKLLLLPAGTSAGSGPHTVYINNVPMGTTTGNPLHLVKTLRAWRERGQLERTVSITINETTRAVHLWCDGGRLYRPVVRSAAGGGTHHHDRRHVVTYLDALEIESYVVAPAAGGGAAEYTEVHDVCMLGYTAALIPFSNHTQSPRVVYYSSMHKQALGLYATNHALRYDTTAHTMYHTQRPLVTTRVATATHYDKMTCGVNCIVAVMTYTSYNQEDCIIVNQSAVDRGLFVSTVFRSVTVDEKREQNMTIGLPADAKTQRVNYNYAKLDPATGIVRVGMSVEPNDVLVARVAKKKTVRGAIVQVDQSVIVQPREGGTVDAVHIHTAPADGSRTVKIRVRCCRPLILGDKLCEVSAQKGTVGLLLPAEDMPFLADGTVPDILINPHALPSRMTISMLLEMLMGTTVCAGAADAADAGAGEEGPVAMGDATPFESSVPTVDELCDLLEKQGLSRDGLHDMYSGFTGERMQARVFVGFGYYQKLRHMVQDKVYARGFGGVNLLTQQPNSGRSKYGGLRHGEMERDALISHGAASMLVDRLYEASDKYAVEVCTMCGSIDGVCACNSGAAEKTLARAPYAFKLLKQYLAAMAIDTRLT